MVEKVHRDYCQQTTKSKYKDKRAMFQSAQIKKIGWKFRLISVHKKEEECWKNYFNEVYFWEFSGIVSMLSADFTFSLGTRTRSGRG